MELDDLKNIWQHTQSLLTSNQDIDNEKVMLMTKQKSKAISDKLRRNLDIDMIVSCLFIPPLFYVIVWTKLANYHKFVAVFFLVYTVVSLVYYFKVVKLYKEIDLKNDVLTTLKFTVNQFEKQVKVLTIYNTVSVVPMMFYGSVVGLELIKYFQPNATTELWMIVFSTVIVTPVGYFYMKYIINVFYGNHLKKLKEHLAELEERE